MFLHLKHNKNKLRPFLDFCAFWSVVCCLQVCSRGIVQDFLLANADHIGEPLAFLLLLLPISLVSWYFVALAYITYTPAKWKMLLGPKVLSFQYLCKAAFFIFLALVFLIMGANTFSALILQGYNPLSYIGGRARENYAIMKRFPLANAFLYCIVRPLQEGIIYRSIIYQHFRLSCGKFASTILSNAFLLAVYFNFGTGFSAFFIGLFLAISCQITGNIVPPIIFHGLMYGLAWYYRLVCM